jgi:DNA polymerase III delta subunit
MPKLEPKAIQKELEQGLLWPVYWLYGLERMKSRELLKRIRAAVLTSTSPSMGLSETVLEGSEVEGEEVLEAALSQSLAFSLESGPSLVVVRDAHAIKNIDALSELLRPRAKKAEIENVCVLIAKDLDGRKKFSKQLLEKAAVVPCEEVAEADREAWIQYLLKRRGMELPAKLVAQLALVDPWSLDIMDQELEKISLLQSAAGVVGEKSADMPDNLLQVNAHSRVRGDDFIAAFFSRSLPEALGSVGSFASQVDEALPLLGLLAWNTRYLALALADSGKALRGHKMNPYLAERLQRWTKLWTLPEVLELQSELAALDLSMKQTPLMPLGIWSELVARFCRAVQ